MHQLDDADIFSLTVWRADGVYTVGVQKHAGDLVKYTKRPVLSEAILVALKSIEPPAIAAPPY